MPSNPTRSPAPLTLVAIKRLVDKGESESLELSEAPVSCARVWEALCGMLNNLGGLVLFGVAPGGRVLGQEVSDGTLHDVTSAVRNIDPAS